jgi:tetratricopeptide (TPR) repeat protein
VLRTAADSNLTDRERAQSLAAKGVTAFEHGNITAAQSLLNQAIDIDPKVYEAHFWLGRLYAQTAGSSASARQKAVEHFRAALQLQPYGEEGDLIRAWLFKVAGRPRSALILPVRSAGQTYYDWTATNTVIDDLSSRAGKEGLAIQVIDERTHLSGGQEGGVGARSYRGVGPAGPTKEDLRQLALDPSGLPSAGWVIFVGVRDVETRYDNKRGYSATATAEVWLGDALGYLLYPKMSPSSSSFGVVDILLPRRKSPTDARDDALRALGAATWDNLSGIMATEKDSQPLDEMLVPTQMPGICARSTAPTFQAAYARKSVAIYYTCPEEDETTVAATQKISGQVQRYLLTSSELNCISPGYAKPLVDDDSTPESIGNSLTRRVGATYGLAAKFGPLKVDIDKDFLGLQTTIRARFAADVAIVSAERGLIWQGPIKVSDESTRFLASDAVDVALRLRAAVTRKMMRAITRQLSQIPETFREPQK